MTNQKLDKLEGGKELIKSFSLQMPVEIYSFFFSVISYKLKQKDFGCTIKKLFLEGLNSLKEKHTEISFDEVDRRFNKIKDPLKKKIIDKKKKIVLKKTSILLSQNDINWINNYINFKISDNIYYSKLDFIADLAKEIEEINSSIKPLL